MLYGGRLFVTWFLFLTAITTTIIIVKGETGGVIYLQLKSLNNLNSKNFNGKCCSSNETTCNQLCGNFLFDIWVDCDSKRHGSQCSYGYKNNATFDSNLGIKKNFIYNFTMFAGTLGLDILTKDQNNSPLQSYKWHTPFYPYPSYHKWWENATLRGTDGSTMNITYQVFCNEHYYGPSCIVGCLPGKNYKCDIQTGKKLCNAGWLGPNCNCTMTRRNSCDIGTGRMLCYPSWYGENCNITCVETHTGLKEYTCGASGEKICESGWYGPECDATISPSQRPSQTPTLAPREQSTEQATKPPSQVLLRSSINEVHPSIITITTTLASQTLMQLVTPSASSQTSHLDREPKQSLILQPSKFSVAQGLTKKEQRNTLLHPSFTVSTKEIAQTTSEEHERPDKTTIYPDSNMPTTSSTRKLPPPEIPVEASRAYSMSLMLSSSVLTDYVPGVAKARIQKDVWWILLVTLTVLALLTVGGLLVMKYKIRKNSIGHHSFDIPLDVKQPDKNSKYEIDEEEQMEESSEKVEE